MLPGYREALDYLYKVQWQPLNVGLVLHLHRLLFQYTPFVEELIARYLAAQAARRHHPVILTELEHASGSVGERSPCATS